eukprot:6478337-Amphidinium_carterae.2
MGSTSGYWATQPTLGPHNKIHRAINPPVIFEVIEVRLPLIRCFIRLMRELVVAAQVEDLYEKCRPAKIRVLS